MNCRVATVATIGLLVIACGRSDLAAPNAGSGGGSSVGSTSSTSTSTTTTTGPGGSGGGGGQPPASCETLVITGDTLELGPTYNPAMFASNADGSRVTIVGYQFMPFGFPIGSSLHHVSFEPWGAWPTSEPAPAYVIAQMVSTQFAAARATDDSFALLFRYEDSIDPGTAHFASRVPLAAEGLGPTDLLITDAPTRPLFVSYFDTETHLIGRAASYASTSPFDTLMLGWATTQLGSLSLSENRSGCVGDDMIGDGVLAPSDQYVVARAGQLKHDCPFSVIADARRWLSTVNFGGTAPAELEWYGETLVEALDLARGQGELWLSIHRAGGPIEVAKLWPNGSEMNAPVAVTEPSEQPRTHAITAFGARAAVAFIDDAADHAQLVVRVLDAQANVLASLGMPPPPGGVFNAGASGSPAILASPAGDALLVAWSDWNGYDDAPNLGHVVRIECAQP